MTKIGDIVQVRDKRDGALAIDKALVQTEPRGATVSVLVIRDGEGSTILNGMTLGVPLSCVEPYAGAN